MHPDLAEYGPVRFHSDPNALYDRHLLFDYAIDPDLATPRERYEAVARSLRDVLALRWLRTKKTHYRARPQARLLPFDGVPDRPLAGQQRVQSAARPGHAGGVPGEERRLVRTARPGARRRPGKRRPGPPGRLLHRVHGDPGSAGHGLWLALRVRHFQTGDSRRLAERKARQLAAPSGSVGSGSPRSHRRSEAELLFPDSRRDLWCRFPASLRRCWEFPSTAPWSAMAAGPSTRCGCGPPARPILSTSISSVTAISSARSPRRWPPSPSREFCTRTTPPSIGQELRFLQEYFLCACSIHDIVRRFRANNADWNLLPDKVAIQLNDTHPTISIAELMRILLDDAGLGWDQAWGITQRTFAYTNHTLLPEALERWPVSWFEDILPRQLEIIYEINRRFLDQVRGAVSRRRSPRGAHEPDRRRRREEGAHGESRHRGIAQHQRRRGDSYRAAEERTWFPISREMFPERFNNKTNGVTPRRWLLVANPVAGERRSRKPSATAGSATSARSPN